MVRKQRALFVVACLAGVAVAACNKSGGAGSSGEKNEVVARVGGRPITQSYFEQRLERMERRFVPDTLDLAGRKEFLDFIVNKELMALKAEELKYGEDPRVVNALAMYADNLAANAAIDRLTEGKLDVSTAEIQQFHDQKQRVVVAKHIVVKTRREAEDVRKRLEGGANFDSMAAIYSVVPRTDANTGAELPLDQRVAFGEVKYGDAIIPVEEAVFATPVDHLSQPVETGYGWHIFLPTHEKTVRIAPLDNDTRTRIEKQIQLRRKRTITEAYYQEIAADHRLNMDEDAVVFVYENLPPDVDPTERPDPNTEVKPVIAFNASDRARTLLEVDGRKVTIGEFSDKYDATSWFERPKRATGALGVKYWIRDRWFRDLQLARARKDGVYESPAVADEIKMRREQMMVTMLHQSMVGDLAPDPTPEDVQKFYEEHTKFYVDQEKRSVAIVFHQQERVVRRAYEEIKGGKDFIEVAIQYNENALGPEHVQSAAFTRDAADYKEIAPAAFALGKVGDRTEPFKTSQGWVLMQLVSVIPERQLELDEIRDAVVADWKNQWQENKLNELLAEWKKSVKVQIDEKALMNAAVNRTDVFVPGRTSAPAGN
jgi:parvulin-like peptidyl-prolyl isomerase